MGFRSPGQVIWRFWRGVADARFSEPRFRAYGLIDGVAYCLAYTIRGGAVRAISLRRAHRKEMEQHGA
jgi:uncharacterized DUF497 family protein